jgi:NAD(P)-dependent dehydrogenase (short-subunit alcohol dehydrogenase family)
MDLAGKTAVITGGASGIGFATAEKMAAAGTKLVLGDIEAGPLDEAVSSLAAGGADVIGVVCDVSKLEDVERLRDASLEAFGAVHVVFNNAGVGGGPTIGAPIEMWRWVSGVNLDGVFYGVHVFLPLLLEQDEGHVVNTASLAGLGGVPGMGPYCATKFAVVGLSESLHHDLLNRRSNVKVSVLCPGFVRTRIAQSSRNMPESLREKVPARDARDMEDIAAAVVAAGIDPSIVADHVLGAITNEEFWILPHHHVAVRTTEQRLEWMRGGVPTTIDLQKATRGG